jgi:neutral ceramidase
MKASCYKVDITPKIGTSIGGNVREDNRSRGVHDPLYANFLYLMDREQGILFIGLDLIGVFGSFVRKIKAGIHKRTGILPEQIVLFATHTHSGPDVMEAFKEGYDPLIAQYIEGLEEKLIRGAVACCGKMWEAELAVGKGYEDTLSFNRRIFMKDGKLRMNWEGLEPGEIDRATGPIDPDVYVLSVKDDQQRIRCLLINFTLHPAVLVGKDWLLSRDYIDRLTRSLQEEYGEELVVLFANGAEGNINHIHVGEPNQTRGFEETGRIGDRLAQDVSEILISLEYIKESKIQWISETIELTRRRITPEQMQEALNLLEAVNWKIPSLLDGVPEEAYAKEILALGTMPEPYVQTELQVLQVGDAAFVSLPGEFFVEFGLSIKKRSPFIHTAVLGMANDYIGYVPTERAFEEGGYEVKTARTSQLIPEAGALVEEKVNQMLTRLKGGGCP